MSLLDMINQQRAKLQTGNKGRPEKLHSEKNVVRFLPAWNGKEDGEFSQDWGQHFIKGTDGTLKAVYMCTATTFGEKCPVCEAIAEGQALTGDEELLKAYKEARSSKRILVNAMYLKGGKHDNPETTPVVLDLPPSVWDQVLHLAVTFLEEGINVFDINAGHNFTIEKSGAGMLTEYKVVISPRAVAMKPEVMEKVKDLAAWARQESAQERDKAVTSVRVIGGYYAAPSDPKVPKLVSGPVATATRPASRLADVSAEDVIDTPASDADMDELNDFLKDLD